MLLVVDVGNTQTHFGVFVEGQDAIAEHWRFATVRDSTGDELAAALSNLLELDPELTLPSGKRVADSLAAIGGGQDVRVAGAPLSL